MLQCIDLTEDETTASSRIYIKILLQELANNLGIKSLKDKMLSDNMQENDPKLYKALQGIFRSDTVQNVRFSINFLTSIGLGALTEQMRDFLKDAPRLLLERKYKEMLELAKQAEDSSESDENSDSDDSSSSSGSSSSDSDSNSDSGSNSDSSGSSSSGSNSSSNKSDESKDKKRGSRSNSSDSKNRPRRIDSPRQRNRYRSRSRSRSPPAN